MEYNNYLCHKRFKYIKKVKGKNGKYRYIYDVKDALGFDEREAYRRTQAITDQAEADSHNAHDVFRKSLSEELEYKIKKDDMRDDDSRSKHLEQQTQMAMNNAQRKGNIARAKKTMSDSALRKYQKTPLYKMEDAIDTGKHYLRRLVRGY